MPLPEPVPGLVIGYAYLWRDEALRGLEEGRKDRPCVIILSVATEAGQTVVTVAPITHAAPPHPDSAVEIPAGAKARLGLDGQRSWVVAAGLNRFIWPGGDLRPVKRGRASYAYGLLPALDQPGSSGRLACMRSKEGSLPPGGGKGRGWGWGLRGDREGSPCDAVVVERPPPPSGLLRRPPSPLQGEGANGRGRLFRRRGGFCTGLAV